LPGQSSVTRRGAALATWTRIDERRYPGGGIRPVDRPRCGARWSETVCHDRVVRRSRTAATALLFPALLHIQVHLHRFHGPPFDYAGLAAAAAASWVGLPGPGEPVLIAAGVLAAKHQLDLFEVLMVAWLSATAGGVVGWAVGLKAGRAFWTAPGPLRAMRIKAADRGEQIFARYPVIAIVMTPSWVAGINRVRSAVYQPTNAISAAVWTLGLGVGGYFVGPPVLELFTDFGTVTAIVVVVVIAGLAAAALLRGRRRARG
jgi:membrane protein DedA with SNARE-associated domain